MSMLEGKTLVSSVLSSAPLLGKTDSTILYLNINMHKMFFKSFIYKRGEGGTYLFQACCVGALFSINFT